MIGSDANRVLSLIAAQAEPRWPHYAAYCRNRESGTRTAAFRHLNEFIAAMRAAAFATRSEFVDWLCNRFIQHETSAASLVPQPLMQQVFLPTLEEWKLVHPSQSTPFRWLGVLTSGIGYQSMRARLSAPEASAQDVLKKAIEIDPEDQIALTRYIECGIGLLDFNAHHLPDHYLGKPDTDLELANASQRLCAGIHLASERERLLQELNAARDVILDWIEAERSGSDFRTWCTQHNRTYTWTITRVYVRR